MRIRTPSVLLLPAMVVGTRFMASGDVEESPLVAAAGPASSLTLDLPMVTPTANLYGVEPREVLPVTARSVTSTTSVVPVPAVPPPPAINPAAKPVPSLPAPTPAPPASSSKSPGMADSHAKTVTSSFHNIPFVTVQWAETFIGGTYSTWLPHTISFDFKPERSEPPAPGKGEIGMGTLTGKTGQTQTVVVIEGAAPTHDASWLKGVAVVAFIGIAGIV